MQDLHYKNNDFDRLDDEGIISGYASVFGNEDSDGDIISKGAYTKTLEQNSDRIAFLYQHDMYQPIGKPIKMEQNETGLYVEAKISSSSLGKDVRTLVKEGALKEFSVGFIPIQQEEIMGKNVIKEIKLFEFSLVTLAANPAAVVTGFKGTKSVDDLVDEFDKLIKICRKMDNPQLLEYELRVLRQKTSLLENQSRKNELTSEEIEAKKISEGLDNFIKNLK